MTATTLRLLRLKSSCTRCGSDNRRVRGIVVRALHRRGRNGHCDPKIDICTQCGACGLRRGRASMRDAIAHAGRWHERATDLPRLSIDADRIAATEAACMVGHVDVAFRILAPDVPEAIKVPMVLVVRRPGWANRKRRRERPRPQRCSSATSATASPRVRARDERVRARTAATIAAVRCRNVRVRARRPASARSRRVRARRGATRAGPTSDSSDPDGSVSSSRELVATLESRRWGRRRSEGWSSAIVVTSYVVLAHHGDALAALGSTVLP